jgi:hypothetical protein
VCVCVCMCTYMHIHKYTYQHAHTHTHTHTQVACTFVAAGTRADTAASTNGGDAVMPWLASASRILSELESMPEAWPFLRPVTVSEAPGYFQVLYHINKKIHNGI